MPSTSVSTPEASFQPKPFLVRVWIAYTISNAPPKISSQAKISAVASAAIPGINTARMPDSISRTPQTTCQPLPDAPS